MSKSKKHSSFSFLFLFETFPLFPISPAPFRGGGPGGREIPAAGRRGPSRWGSRRKERRAREMLGEEGPQEIGGKTLSLSLFSLLLED